MVQIYKIFTKKIIDHEFARNEVRRSQFKRIEKDWQHLNY